MVSVRIENFIFQDGDVERVSFSKNSNIDVMTMPMSDSSESMLFDVDGVEGSITINGGITDAVTTRVQGRNVLTIEQQINYLKSLINGNQSSVVFTSNYYSTQVMISKVEFTEESGSPNRVVFSIDLVEGKG